MILEEWFNSNISKPNANRHQKNELALKTSLTPKQISNWLLKKRKKLNSKNKENVNRLSTKDKIFLKNFFKNVSKRPTDDQISEQCQSTVLVDKKILSWLHQNVLRTRIWGLKKNLKRINFFYFFSFLFWLFSINIKKH